MENKNFEGFALARSMKNLALALETIIADDEAEAIFDPVIYAKVVAEAKELIPHVKVLSGGQVRKETSRLNPYRAANVEFAAAEASAIYVYVWLKKANSPLLSLMKFPAKG